MCNRYLPDTIILFLSSFFFISTISAQKQPVDSLLFADSYAGSYKYDKAYRIYSKNTDRLNSQQQFLYAEVLLNTSKGKPERLKEAYIWYKKSSDAGNEKGMHGLMRCYMGGYGVSKDSVMGLTINQKLVDLGNIEGIYLMAWRYEEGNTVEKDKKKAYDLFSKAANKGHNKSAYILGKKELEGGSGSGALLWFTKSSGYIPSMLKLAEIYDKGLGGIPENSAKALNWYNKITREEDYNHITIVEKRIREIGAAEPSTDINLVKPKFLSLLSGGANNYRGLISEETQPLNNESDGDKLLEISSSSKYYTCTIKLEFKNALIRERKVREPENNEIRKIYADNKIVPGTYYTYKGEIVNSVSNGTAISIFNQWVNLIKTILPNVPTGANTDAKFPAYGFYPSMSNGKKLLVKLYVSSENVMNDNDYEVIFEVKEE